MNTYINNSKYVSLGAKVLCFIFLIVPMSVDAASVSWTNSTPYTTAKVSTYGATTGASVGLQDIYTTVIYSASSNVSESASNIKKGDQVVISVPYSDSDISWFGSGSYNDSPVGHWGDWLNSCALVNDMDGGGVTSILYGQLIVTRPTPTISSTGMTCTGVGPFTCTVTTASGAISATVTFPSTSGKVRTELWEIGKDGMMPPDGGVAINKNPDNNTFAFLGFFTKVANKIIPRAYAGLAQQDTSSCNDGGITSFTVPLQSITFNFSISSPPTCVSGWSEESLVFDGPPNSGPGWCSGTSYGACASGTVTGSHDPSVNGSITTCCRGSGNLGYARNCGAPPTPIPTVQINFSLLDKIKFSFTNIFTALKVNNILDHAFASVANIK